MNNVYFFLVNTTETPDVVSKPNFLASVSLAVEQAGKLGSGKNRRIICMFNTFQVIFKSLNLIGFFFCYYTAILNESKI